MHVLIRSSFVYKIYEMDLLQKIYILKFNFLFIITMLQNFIILLAF